MDGADGWAHTDGLAGFEPPLPCLAPQVGMGGGGQHPPNPKPNVRAAPWAYSVPLCVTAGLGTPGRGDEPDALLGWPWGHAGDASWLLGRVAHALWPGRWQGKGMKCAEVPSQEGATQCHHATREWGQRAEPGWCREHHRAEGEGGTEVPGLWREA